MNQSIDWRNPIPADTAASDLLHQQRGAMEQKSILLVDDERLIRHSLTRDLAKEDFVVTAASSGEEGIARIGDAHFDLVITDLSLPGLDGFQVLKAAKRRDVLTMVIILTGCADQQDSVDALRLDADDFLEKPCDTGELLFRISNCFAKQAVQKNARLAENILMVCCYCKKIRCGRQGEPSAEHWYRVEDYLAARQWGEISHGCCPHCLEKQIQEIYLQ